MSKRSGLADIAAAAGVSTATVDRVLNGRGGVSPDKERRVLDWARKLNVDRNLDRRPTRIVRIGVVMQKPANPFYELLRRAFVKANSVYFNVSILITQFYFDVLAPGETADLLRRLAKDQDALIVILQDHPLISAALHEITPLIPVVTMVSDLPLSGRATYVGLDNRAAGRVAGELMGRFVGPAGGGVVVVSGLQRFVGQGEREMGFRSVLAEQYRQCHLVTVVETREQPDKAGDLVRNVLEKNPDIVGIYNVSSGDQGIADALRRFGREKQTVFITHELTPDRRALLLEGVVDAVIDQNPELEALTAVEFLAKTFGRSEVQEINKSTPISIYLRENC